MLLNPEAHPSGSITHNCCEVSVFLVCSHAAAHDHLSLLEALHNPIILYLAYDCVVVLSFSTRLACLDKSKRK